MSGKPVYCLDTSSLIEAWSRSYRPKRFASFWRRLEALIAEGRCKICEEVRTEIEQDTADLIGWVRQQPGLVVDFDRAQELAVQEVMDKYPNLVNLNKNKGWADGFVLALAKARGYTVVTEEGIGAREGPKIPYVCREYGIPWLKLADMIDQEEWDF